MGTYASSSDVTARIPTRPVGTSSAPSTTNIDAWIAGAEAKLAGRLSAAGIAVPVTNADGILILREWICDYAQGRALMAIGGGSDEDPSYTAGVALVRGYQEWLDTISQDPAGTEAELNGGSSSSSNRLMRGYAIDNADSKTIAAGDFDPTFTRDEVF